MIGFGWLTGVLLGLVAFGAALAALSLPQPPALALVAGLLGPLSPLPALLLAIVVLAFVYLGGYALATASLAPFIPSTITFPLAGMCVPPAPTVLPSAAGERFARGLMIGHTALLDAVVMGLAPRWGPYLAAWAFVVISLAIFTTPARNRVYHGLLGWSAWLFPMSWLATSVGLLLFVVNVPFALAAGGSAAFRIDCTTGVIETTGGLPTMIAGRSFRGFSLGNFNFLRGFAEQTSFLVPGVASHETGHTLNTAAMGGVLLWINAIDENVFPSRMNLAYGELMAQSHANGLASPPEADFWIRVWG
jgi:hypothetical protein